MDFVDFLGISSEDASEDELGAWGSITLDNEAKAKQAREDDELQHRKALLDTWLASIYGNNPIPPYEVNHATVTALLALAEQTRQSQQRYPLVLEDVKNNTLEYSAEGHRLREVVSSLGLSTAVFSQPGKTRIKTLCQLANTLQLKNVKKSSFLTAFSELTTKEQEGVEALRKEIEMYKTFKQQTQGSMKELTQVNQMYKRFKVEREEQKKVLSVVGEVRGRWMQEKKKYETQRAALSVQLQASGISQDLTHSGLVQLAKEGESRRMDATVLVDKLKKYHDIPVDINLATERIAEAKEKLKTLEDRFSQNVLDMYDFKE